MVKSKIINEDEEIKFKKRELRELVLAALGISLVLGGSIVLTPNFPIVLGIILKIIQDIKHKPISDVKVKRVLQNLEKNKIISLQRRNDEVEILIKKRFHTRILKYSIKRVLELKKKEKKWVGKWFMVVFDVPEVQRNKRDYFRRFLKELGFYPYQKSIYLYPCACEEEILLIKKIVEGDKYIKYIVAEKIENDKDAKIFFGINKTIH